MIARDFSLRHASRADIREMREMQQRSMRELGARFYAPEAIERFLCVVSTMDDGVVDEGHFFVAINSFGRLVGTGAWSRATPVYEQVLALETPHTPASAVVRSIYVDPEMARQGVGTSIMRKIEADAREAGILELTLTASLSGVPLYDRVGYRATEYGELDLGSCKFAYVKMARSLMPVALKAVA